jgi:CheY-like chemotaxis protein
MNTPQPPAILVVSADEILAEVASFRLELLGYAVQIARNAEDALEHLKQQLPSIFLVQLELPGMSGPAFIEQLATETNTARLPILAISTETEMASVERAISAGASDYLVVPFDLLVLEAKVATLLEMQATADKNAKQLATKE